MTGGMAVAPPFLAVETAFLPTRSGGFQVTAFQEAAGPCHLALHRGHLKAATPLLRVQSHCLPGTALQSRLCDCGDQVRAALRLLGRAPAGVLIYLDQEARGHGLLAKVAVMRHLNQGCDLVEAQRRAGRPEDLRSYGMVRAMLEHLGVGEVDLLTSNPGKAERPRRGGVVSCGAGHPRRLPAAGVLCPGHGGRALVSQPGPH